MAVKLAANPDRLMRYTVEKTAREVIPGFFVYVIVWSFLMAGAGSLAGAAAGLVLCYMVTAQMSGTLPLQSELDLYIRFFSMAFFGLFLATSLRRQIQQWEGMITEFEEQEYQPRETVHQSVIRPMVKPQEQRTATHAMIPSTYPKRQNDAAALYNNLAANNWRFVRDVIDVDSPYGGKVFTNLTANFSAILSEWQRMGWVDDDKNLTADGRYWLETNSPAGTINN